MASTDGLRAIVIGLGPIGVAAARAIRAEAGIDLVGMVDTDPAKQGLTLAELGGPVEQQPSRPSDEDALRVAADCADVAEGADVAVLTTTSALADAAPAIERLLAHRLAVVSSCEEMSWPWYRHAELARRLDAAARDAGRAILAAGVNPGFVFDLFPVVLSSMLRRVYHVRAVRRVDAAVRRKPLQAKVGAALSVEQFNDLKAAGRIGHRGLCESVAMLATGLGHAVEPGSITETLEPVLADKPTPSALGLIQPGRVAGIHNTAAWHGPGLDIELDLAMAVGISDPIDKIILQGPVQVVCKIPGSLPGDSATVAALLNHIPVVHQAAPGLRTMLDVRPAGCHNRDLDAQGGRGA